MAEAGCVEIYYGIETGSSAMQHAIHKDLDLDWAREIVRSTARLGIRAVTGFIVGYPIETPETLSHTLDRFFDFLQVGGYRAHLFALCAPSSRILRPSASGAPRGGARGASR
jgi:radical SAM superfamily enzyme YgiQ (UPF0313 family)